MRASLRIGKILFAEVYQMELVRLFQGFFNQAIISGFQ